MQFSWIDYDKTAHSLIEDWLDEDGRYFTACEDGWDANYEYWKNEPDTGPNGNYWCKVVYREETPVAAILLASDGEVLHIMEILTAPGERGKGYGSGLLKELVSCGTEIIGHEIRQADACIFADNARSQKAFEKAGFAFEKAHPDGDVWYYSYRAMN